jgi:importin subunit alpha-1
LSNIASGTNDQTDVVINAGAIPVFIKLLQTTESDIKEQIIWGLGNIIGDSPTNRDNVLESGVMEPILKIIRYENPTLTMLRICTWTLSNLCRGKPIPPLHLVSPALPILAKLCENDDEEVLVDALWSLSFVSEGPTARVQAIIDTNVLPQLIECLATNVSVAAQVPALRTIGNIVMGNDEHVHKLLNNGILPVFRPLLANTREEVRKEVLWTISNITAGNTALIQAVIDAGLIPDIIDNMHDETDNDILKEAAYAIANISVGNADQVQYLVENDALHSFCVLLDCNDNRIICVALDGLVNMMKSGEQQFGVCNNYVQLVAEEYIMDLLKEFETNDEPRIVEQACLLSKYIEMFNVIISLQDMFKTLLLKRTGTSMDPLGDCAFLFIQ